MAEWRLEASGWPLAELRLHPSDDDHGRLDTFLVSVEGLLSRPGPCVVVLDLSGAEPDAHRRQRLAELVARDRARIDRVVHAAAVVVPSAFHRGILTAVKWLNARPLALEWQPFATYGEARAWAEGRLRELPATSAPRTR
jgi:hypothetical protein